jgi:Amidohydrolase
MEEGHMRINSPLSWRTPAAFALVVATLLLFPSSSAFSQTPEPTPQIGEFSIHKEFVSAKISGEVASLQDPALDRLIDFATEVGLVVLIHNDVDVPFAKPGAEPAYAAQMKALFKRHPNTTFIWAHIGVGRIIRPVREQAAIVEEIINNPKLGNVHFDISWDEVAKCSWEAAHVK